MWVDGGTKYMDKTNFRKTLERGTWSVTYNEEFTKQTSRKAKKADTTTADHEADQQKGKESGYDYC